MIQFRGCQTNGVSKSNVKKVMKKLLENTPKRIGGEKKQMMQMMGLTRPMVIKIMELHRGNHFLQLNIGST